MVGPMIYWDWLRQSTRHRCKTANRPIWSKLSKKKLSQFGSSSAGKNTKRYKKDHSLVGSSFQQLVRTSRLCAISWPSRILAWTAVAGWVVDRAWITDMPFPTAPSYIGFTVLPGRRPRPLNVVCLGNICPWIHIWMSLQKVANEQLKRQWKDQHAIQEYPTFIEFQWGPVQNDMDQTGRIQQPYELVSL